MTLDPAPAVTSTAAGVSETQPYTSPSTAERVHAGTGLARMAIGDLAGAATLLGPLGFTITTDLDPATGRRYAMAISETTTPRAWGLYLVDLSKPLGSCIAVPHPKSDANCEKLALRLWRALPGSMFAMSAVHRDAASETADHSQNTESVFHHLWTNVVGPRGVPQVQIHGFRNSSASEHVVVSTGAGPITPAAVRIADEIAATGLDTTRSWDGTANPNLDATTNAQGIAADTDGWVWVHVELNRTVRDDTTLWQPAIDAVAAANTPLLAYDRPSPGGPGHRPKPVGAGNTTGTSRYFAREDHTHRGTASTQQVATVARSAGADFLTDGIDDNVQIQAAIDAVVAGGGGTVLLRAGTYSLTASLRLAASNVRIIGEGMGVTNLACAASVTGNTPAITVGNDTTGSDLSLAASTAVGDSSITMTSANTATLGVGDWLLLKSNRQVDSENSSKFAGELHHVTAVDTGTGAVAVNDVIHDAYLTSDSARVCKINMIRNVTLQDMSVTTVAPSSTLRVGFINFRFVENLQVTRVEMHHAFHSMQLRSCINSKVTDCYIHHINDVTPAANLRYGIWIAAASQNIAVAGCRFAQCRHAVTFGTNTGTNGNGIQRSVTVSNCVSMQTDTSHYDTHEPCDGISFVNCAAIGGMPFAGSGAAIGFQSRGKNVTISGCVIKDIPGRGIMLFNAASTGTIVTGNTITNITQVDASDGIGIFLDSAGPSRHVITNNVIRDCDWRAISGAGGSSDIVIANNLIDDCPSTVTGASVRLSDAQRVSIAGNVIINNRFGRPVQMAGTSDEWTVTNNQFYNNSNNSPALVGANNSVFNNDGVNPQSSHALGDVTGSATFNRVNGSMQTAILTGDVGTVTITAGQNVGDELTLMLTQDATGGRTFTWPTNAKLAGGVLTLSITPNAVDVVRLAWDGTNWREVSRALGDS